LRGDGGWFDGKQRLGWRAEGSGRGGCFMSVLLAQNYPCAARPVRACFHGRVRSTPPTPSALHQYPQPPPWPCPMLQAPSDACACTARHSQEMKMKTETGTKTKTKMIPSRAGLGARLPANTLLPQPAAWPGSLQWVGQQMTQPARRPSPVARRRPRRICVNAPRQTNHRRTRILIPRA
jgi:hypothetical protein